MKYKDYDIEHFVTDEFFIQWVKKPNENNSHFWEKWIAQHPEKRLLVNEAAHLIRSVKYSENPEFTDQMYVETFEQILRGERQSQLIKLPPISKKGNSRDENITSFFTLRGVAASILVFICLWLQYEAFHTKSTPSEIVETPLIIRSNPAGQKSHFELSDGTKVYLNSKSEIEFPKKFAEDVRLVKVNGEAFFDVKKEQRPFIVESGNTTIEVLGTSFNINQKENGDLYIALVNGKVSVNTENGSKMTLNPNEMLLLKEGGTFSKSAFDPSNIIAWKDNFLVFKNSNLSELKEKLEMWYDVTIIVEGQTNKNLTYTGIYKDEMLENVLRGISTTSGISYRIENKKIFLTIPR